MTTDAEIIRKGMEAINAGDAEGLRAFASPDIEIRDPDRTTDVFRGHEAMLAFLAEWGEAFDDYAIEIDELMEAPDGRIVMLGTQRGRGKGSGIEITDQINMVMRMEGGVVKEMVIFGRRESALVETGFEE